MPSKLTVYEAVSLDITMAAGGPMGSPTEENWRKLFRKPETARKACEADYGKPIKWKWGGKRGWTSGDLMHVEYTVQPVVVL